jgi:hypothetical protein
MTTTIQRSMYAIVEYLPGDGTKAFIRVAYIADYPRDEDGLCAYCHGDPLAQSSAPNSFIAGYYVRNPRAETCPLCDGRAA